MVQLFLNLILAHVIGDFYFQTNRFCESKKEKSLKGIMMLLIHMGIIFALTWLASWSCRFLWGAAVIGVGHLLIDVIKVCVEVAWYKNGEKSITGTKYAIWPFIIDQVFHVALIAAVTWWWLQYNDWNQPSIMSMVGIRRILLALVLLLCWKPANLLVGYILRYCELKIVVENKKNLKPGALIGVLERWLVVFFIAINVYEGIGFLIAAKSIRHFSKTSDSDMSEYVLVGTLLSITIGVACGSLLLL